MFGAVEIMYPICDICGHECFMDMNLSRQKLYEGICFRCVQVLHKIRGKFSPIEFETLRAAVLTGDLEQSEFFDIMDKAFFAPN